MHNVDPEYIQVGWSAASQLAPALKDMRMLAFFKDGPSIYFNTEEP